VAGIPDGAGDPVVARGPGVRDRDAADRRVAVIVGARVVVVGAGDRGADAEPVVAVVAARALVAVRARPGGDGGERAVVGRGIARVAGAVVVVVAGDRGAPVEAAEVVGADLDPAEDAAGDARVEARVRAGVGAVGGGAVLVDD